MAEISNMQEDKTKEPGTKDPRHEKITKEHLKEHPVRPWNN